MIEVTRVIAINHLCLSNSGKNHFQSKILSWDSIPEYFDTKTTTFDHKLINSDSLILDKDPVASRGSIERKTPSPSGIDL